MAHHEQDASGQWWYVWGEHGRTTRTRVSFQDCEECGVAFLPKSRGNGRTRRFCSRQCSMRTTGKSFSAYGPRHPKWKGGRDLDANGYVRLWLPPEERARYGRSVRGGRIKEHRYVMAQMLGRPLEPHEQVHHKNGIRDDNRPENLELWSRSHPDGVRASDRPHCATCTCGDALDVGAAVP